MGGDNYFNSDDWDNAFGGVFSGIFNATKSADNYKNDLDKYWLGGRVKEYYETLYRCKDDGYRVMRNSDGIHMITKK